MLELAEIFQNGVVLQRNETINVFGKATMGNEIVAKLMNDDKLLSMAGTFANADSSFLIKLEPQAAMRGLVLSVENISTNEQVIFTDVAIGEVWLAGGQSNMEFFNKYDKDWNTTSQGPFNPDIHMFNVTQRAFAGHETHTHGGYGYWFCDGESGFEVFSAPAYSFAKHIQPEIGVPVALIGCNWGGSTASAWVPRHVLENYPLNIYLDDYENEIKNFSDEQLFRFSMAGWQAEDDIKHYEMFEPLLYGRDRAWQMDYLKKNATTPAIPMGPYNINRPSGLYEYMLKTIIPFAMKGVLWYQGETDSDKANIYDVLLSSLIEDWRKEWGLDLQFLIVQLAPFGKWLDCTNDDYRIVRAMQQKVADTMDGVYMASIMDIGSYYDIHPKEKMEVGRRLGLLALKHVYDMDVLGDCPRFESATINDKIVVKLENAKGLHDTGKHTDIVVKIDETYYSPEFAIIDDTLVINWPKDAPSEYFEIEIRLGWGDYATIGLVNEAGLALAPFKAVLQLKAL